MGSADWEHWAEVFRTGSETAGSLIDPNPGGYDPGIFAIARILGTMAGTCDEHAAAARAAGR